jgi:hypothetical protein
MLQTHSKYHTKWEKTENIPSTMRNRRRESTFITLIQYSAWNFSQRYKTREENKRDQIWKEEVKIFFCVGDIIQYLEDLKDSTRRFSNLVKKFSKVTGCKIYIQNSVAFLYTNSNFTMKKKTGK